MSAIRDEERVRSEYARRTAEIPAGRYAIAQPSAHFAYLSQKRHAVEMLRLDESGLRGKRVLDVGCGSGQWLVDCESWGAVRTDLCGIDLLPERVATASARLSGADIRCGSARELPWESDAFDLLVCSTLFSSILDDELQNRIASEMMRVLRPNGMILWYDMAVNNPYNRNVKGIGRQRVRRLFAESIVTTRRITLVPGLARSLAPRSWWLATTLESFRIFNTHLMAVIRKANQSGK